MVIDFINRLSARAELSPLRLVGWLDLSRSKYYDWPNFLAKNSLSLEKRAICTENVASTADFSPCWHA
jgi:hypothetical protein